MRSNKNIVFFVPGFPKNEEDSTCIPALQNYVYYFSKYHPEVQLTVIAFQYPYPSGKYQWHSIPVYAAGGNNRGGLYRMITWLRVIYYFFLIYLKKPITIIHSFWVTETAYLGQLLAKLYNLKHISTVMGQDAKNNNLYLKHIDFSKVTITCGSQYAAKIFQQATGYKVHAILPIGIDKLESFAKKEPYRRDIDILGVGSLIPLKNYQLFVTIISELIDEFPDLHAVIIGDGSQKQDLLNLIEEKRLGRNLRLIGQQPRPQVIEFMYQSKILLHPSLYEAQGYVFMEGLYCGLTVVAFEVGYLEESQKVFICQNELEMIHALKILLRSHSDYLPIQMKTIEETVHQFENIYHL